MYSIPDADVSILLNNLSQILKYNSHLIADVRDNVEALHQELENLKGLIIIKDHAKYNYDGDYCLKELGNEIKTIVHQAEDVVETYIFQQAVAQTSRDWISEAFQIIDYPKRIRDVRKEIEQVNHKIMQINQVKAKSGHEVMQRQGFVNLDRPTKPKKSSKMDEEQIIGFDGAVEEVSKLLAGGSEQFEAISIVGVMGNEKTKLAKKVFRDPSVDYEFMIRVFVHVSKGYDKREVLLKILSSFRQINNDELNETMSEDQLEKHLHQQLEGKQYLIILDDVFEEEDWNRFKHAFPHNNKRCRVLITTCNEKVAEKSNPKIPFYSLDFLALDKSLELFHRKVFGDNDHTPEELQPYETQIVEKCGGLPLAMVLIAGVIWNHRNRVDWWKYVADSINNYHARDQEQITKIMELMYMHLPNHLKPCFIYLGVFPEDFEIPVWKLLRLWMAEGLIQVEGDINLEDTAEHYLEELVCRNLLMVGKRRSCGKIKTFRIHDTLLGFCKNKAIDENLFQEINKDNISSFLSGNEALDQYRRLCINNVNIHDYISKKRPSGKCVRSFLTFPKEEEEEIVEPKFVNSIPRAFKLLRVLEVESLIFTRFPIDLSRLVLLKYIAISSTFSALPPVMSIMWNLQTLIVNTSSPTLEIRANIWKMPQLRHLHTNSSTILPGPHAELNQKSQEALVGVNIQTLSTISPESCRKEVFDHAPKLKKLGICGALTKLFEVNGECSLFGNLGKLEFLENLKLLNDDVTSILYGLPSEKSFPRKLTKLTLENTLLNWNEMSILGKLQNLEILKLKDHAFEGKLWKTEKGGFLRLNYLHIGHTDLVVWEASADHFPKLKCLELKYCYKLQALPQGLADILSLQSIVLHCTNPSLASSATKLQMLKLEQAQNCNKNRSLKLFIYPPDHSVLQQTRNSASWQVT